jgi:hypothetical protein
MVTTSANIADIVMTAGELLSDEVSIILRHRQNNAHRRIGEYLLSIEKAVAVLLRLCCT